MAHLVSPTGFRSGKTSLWKHTEVIDSSQQQQLLTKQANTVSGLEKTLDSLLQKQKVYVVKTSIKRIPSGALAIKVLYYPLAVSSQVKRSFPLYTTQTKLTDNLLKLTEKVQKPLRKLWLLKQAAFNNRFVLTKQKIQLNKWLSGLMFKGSYKGLAQTKLRSVYLDETYWNEKTQKRVKWYNTALLFNDLKLSALISCRLGERVQITTMNVFDYLSTKQNVLSLKGHQDHIWDKSYQFHKKRISSYYDVVNTLYLLCKFPKVESLVLKVIQEGLTKMHKRKIKPKQFFYFIDSVVKKMPLVQDTFAALRIIITGKLKGGTARTNAFSAGFGAIPRQSLGCNIRYEYGEVSSKYGLFGIKIVSWRKSQSAQNASALVRKISYS